MHDHHPRRILFRRRAGLHHDDQHRSLSSGHQRHLAQGLHNAALDILRLGAARRGWLACRCRHRRQRLRCRRVVHHDHTAVRQLSPRLRLCRYHRHRCAVHGQRPGRRAGDQYRHRPGADHPDADPRGAAAAGVRSRLVCVETPAPAQGIDVDRRRRAGVDPRRHRARRGRLGRPDQRLGRSAAPRHRSARRCARRRRHLGGVRADRSRTHLRAHGREDRQPPVDHQRQRHHIQRRPSRQLRHHHLRHPAGQQPDRDRRAAHGRQLRLHRRAGSGKPDRHAGRQHWRRLSDHTRRQQRHPARRQSELHADRQPGAGGDEC